MTPAPSWAPQVCLSEGLQPIFTARDKQFVSDLTALHAGDNDYWYYWRVEKALVIAAAEGAAIRLFYSQSNGSKVVRPTGYRYETPDALRRAIASLPLKIPKAAPPPSPRASPGHAPSPPPPSAAQFATPAYRLAPPRSPEEERRRREREAMSRARRDHTMPAFRGSFGPVTGPERALVGCAFGCGWTDHVEVDELRGTTDSAAGVVVDYARMSRSTGLIELCAKDRSWAISPSVAAARLVHDRKCPDLKAARDLLRLRLRGEA